MYERNVKLKLMENGNERNDYIGSDQVGDSRIGWFGVITGADNKV